MRVFITGATGVLGRRVVPALIAKGHAVVALSRSDDNKEWITHHGAEARSGNLFDTHEMASASEDCDAILHLATAIPVKTRTSPGDWSANDRIRREGTSVLIEAALKNKCTLYLQQSVTFLYGDTGGEWVDETSPLPEHQPAVLQSALDMEEMINTAIKERGLPGVILRFGSFYSHDSRQTSGMLSAAKAGRFPIIGDGSAFWNMLSVDDAASAVVTVVKDSPRGIGRTFNICDDSPVMVRDLAGFLAEQLGGRTPRKIPRFLATLLIGSHVAGVLTASVRCRNDRAKHELGWTPRSRDYRAGFAREIEVWRSAQ